MLFFALIMGALIPATAAVGLFGLVVGQPKPGRSKGSIIATYAAITAVAAATGGYGLSVALPDHKPNQLEAALPGGWRDGAATRTPAGEDQTERFSSEAAVRASALRQAISADQTGTSVQAFMRVQEGDGQTMAAVMRQHIEASGGHAAPEWRREVVANVPASYTPCLTALTTAEPRKTETEGYRAFAQMSVAQRTVCTEPQTNGPRHNVTITVLEAPVGRLDDGSAQFAAAVLFVATAAIYCAGLQALCIRHLQGASEAATGNA